MLVAIVEKDRVAVKRETGTTVRLMMQKGVLSANISPDESLLAVTIADYGVKIFKGPGFTSTTKMFLYKDITDARWSTNDTIALTRKGFTELRNVKTGAVIRTIR